MSFSLLAFLVVETEPNGQRSIALYGENGVGVDCRVLKAFGESTKRQEKKKSLGTIPISIPPHLLSLSQKHYVTNFQNSRFRLLLFLIFESYSPKQTETTIHIHAYICIYLLHEIVELKKQTRTSTNFFSAIRRRTMFISKNRLRESLK